MPHFVVISTIYPYPADIGKKVVLGNILEYLVHRYGPDNVTYIQIGRSTPVGGSDPLQVLRVPPPGFVSQAANLAIVSALTASRSMQESVIYSPRVERRVAGILRTLNPSLIVYDTLRVGQFAGAARVAAPRARHVLYMDDLMSVRYARMLRAQRRLPQVDFDPLGSFGVMVAPILRWPLRHSWVQRAVVEYERRLIRRRECQAVDRFDLSLLVNAREVEEIRRRTGATTVRTLKFTPPTDAAARRCFDGTPTFVFLGSLKVPHNAASLMWFLDAHMPALLRRLPAARLRVIGRDAPAALLERGRRYGEAVTFEGFVANLAPILDRCCAMIVPLLFGSGVKVKTLEALARGVPVLATSYGAEGINLTPHSGCIVEDRLDRYPELMAQMCDRDFNRRLSQQAHDFFHREYDRATVWKEYDAFFQPG